MALLLDLLVTGQTRLNDDTYAKDIYADKFIRTGSSDLYVLLGGGGHKLLSDFSMAHNHPYLPLAGGTMTGNITFNGDVGIYGTNCGGKGILSALSSTNTWDGVANYSCVVVGAITSPVVIRTSSDNLQHYNAAKGERYTILDSNNFSSWAAAKDHGHDGAYVKVLGSGTYNPLGAYVRPIYVDGTGYDYLSPYTPNPIYINTNLVLQTVSTSDNTNFRPLLLGDSNSSAVTPTFSTVTSSTIATARIFVKPSTGDLHLYNPEGNDSPFLYFQRGNFDTTTTFDWRMFVSSGNFYLQHDYGGWTNALSITYENVATFANKVYATEFIGNLSGNASSATIASTVVCPVTSSNYDRPIVGTPGNNTLYHTTLATVNWSTGNLKSGGLNATGDVTTTKNFVVESGDDDHYLLFRYANGTTYNWRIGYLGSGSGDANYLVFQSSKTDGNFVNALRFGLTTLNAVFYGKVGIGKDAPDYNLDVTGNARFTKEVVLTSGSSAAYDKTALSFVNTSGGEQARIGTDAGNGLGLYAGGNIYLRPASSFSASSIGLVIYSDNLTYNGNNVLHAGNSSVSGGGSSWNSSITVTMNGTSKTLTIPGNPNTDYRVTQTVTSSGNTSWRPIIVGQSYNDSEPFSPSTVTDSVLATHMVKLRPSTGEIVTQGNITLYNPTSGASPALIFQREKIDNYTSWIDWKIYDDGGNLYIDHNYGKWTNKLILRHDVVGLATLDGYDLFHTGNLFTRYLGVNGTDWTFASTYNSSTSTSIYAPTTAGTNNYVLKSTGGIPTWIPQSDISAGYATLAGTVTCTPATSNTDRPILVTNEANGLYYTTNVKLNYSTGIISAGGFSTSGNIVLHNTSGGDSPHLHFQRGAQNDGTYDWDMYIKDGGLFKIRYNNGSWHEVLSMTPNDIYTSWSITADGGFIGTATNADKVDGYHADSFVHRLRRTNLNISSTYSGMVPPDILSFKNGYAIYTDPEFAYGNNSISVYNNSGGSAVWIARENSTTSGNSSGYCLHIHSAASGASPYGGGWCFGTSGSQARVSVCLFRANIPAGYNVEWHSNSTGSGASSGWLTSTDGTGKYEWYAYMVEWGSSPSSSFYFTLNKAAAVDWYLAYANVIDISKSGYDGLRTRRSDALVDSNNGTSITASYAAGGFSSTPSWLAAWNNYHLTYVSPGSITVGKASTVACPATSSNYDRPIVGTPGDSTLYHSTKATVNWSTGRINCGGVTFTDSTGGSSFIRYASHNVDTKIFRVYSADHTYAESAAYGFDLTYTGSGSGNENKLVLKADNQAGSQVSVFTAYQDGNITFSNTPKVGSTAVSLSNHGHDGAYVKVLGAGTYNPLGAYVRPIVVNGSSYDFLSPYTTTGITINTNNVTQTVSTSGNTSFRPVLLGASYSSSTSAPAFADITGDTIAAAKLFVKPDTGDLYLYSASGDSPHLVFQRVGQNDGTYDWDQYVSGGTFYLRYNGGSWVNVLSMYPSGITSAWQITAPAFYESSDERLKDFYNSVDVDLDKLSSLPKKFFKWKSKPNGEFEIGTSAQELQKIYPQLVNTDDKGYLTVAYDKLSIIALRAIDKLYEMNKNLERRIQILESKR